MLISIKFSNWKGEIEDYLGEIVKKMCEKL